MTTFRFLLVALGIALFIALPAQAAPPPLSFSESVIELDGSFSIPQASAVADLDHRNGPDIVVLGHHGDLAVLLNRGDGTFGAPSYLPPMCEASSVLVGQFSADSNPDLLVACEESDTAGFKRLLGAGDGTFGPPQTLAPIQPHLGDTGELGRLRLASFGGNGEAVTYTASAFPSLEELFCFFPVADLIADYDAFGTAIPRCSRNFSPDDRLISTFAIAGNYALAPPPFAWPEDAAFAALPDGNLGALVYDAGFSEEEYSPPATIPGAEVYAVAGSEVVALTGDTNFVVYHLDPSTPVSPGIRAIAAPVVVPTDPAAGYPSDVVLADFDGDGAVDTAVLTELGDGETGTIQFFPANGAPQSIPTNSDGGTLTVADLDGDGRLDLVNLNRGSQYVTVQLNRTGAGSANQQPTCADAKLTVSTGSTLNGTTSCSDPDSGDTVTVSRVAGPSHGALTLQPDGSFTYIPEAGFAGDDAFTFEATDSHGARSSVATESVLVYNTPLGSNVVVRPATGVRITFTGVSSLGVTTATPLPTAPPLPAGFIVAGGSSVWELSTTVTFTPPVEVCVDAAGIAQPHLFHDGHDVTTRLDPPFVCGLVSSFSPFVVAQPVDTTPPVLTVPSSVTKDATSPTGAVVTFTATARDDVDQKPAVRCTPASGSVFAIGTTLVSCTATDAAGNAASASFTVHVRGAGEQIAALLAKTRAYLGLPALSQLLLQRLQDAADALVAKNKQAACSLLAFYGTAVKVIVPVHAAELVGDANRIRAVIGCA